MEIIEKVDCLCVFGFKNRTALNMFGLVLVLINFLEPHYYGYDVIFGLNLCAVLSLHVFCTSIVCLKLPTRGIGY